MILKNIASQGVYLFAVDTTANPPNGKTGNAANITGHYTLDGAAAGSFGTTNPTEIGGGVYWQPLAQGETNGNAVGYYWASSTTGIVIEPVLTFTSGVNLPAAAYAGAGGLITSGTGTAQLTTSSGQVTVGAYASGQDPATQVLDAAQSAHNTSGTIGYDIGHAASAGDPWATALPGPYISGEAGYILGTFLAATVPTAAQNASAVWSTAVPGAFGAGTAGYDLGNIADGSITIVTADPWAAVVPGAYGAGTAGYDLGNIAAGSITVVTGDPWAKALPGAYTAGEAGYILGTFLAATVPTAAQNASAVWSTAVPGAFGAGTAGYDLGNIADGSITIVTADPWATALPGAYIAGEAGYILGTFLAGGAAFDPRIQFGTCPSQAGMTATQIKLAAGASATDGLYIGDTIYLTGGAGAGQQRSMVSYTGATKVAGTQRAWTIQPDNTTTYAVLAGPIDPLVTTQLAAYVSPSLGSIFRVDSNNFLKVDVEDVLGATAVPLAMPLPSNITEVNGTPFVGPRVPASVDAVNETTFVGSRVPAIVDTSGGVNLTEINGVDISAYGGIVPAQVNQYLTGQDPATLVWNATASSFNTAGSMGAKVNLLLPLDIAATVNDTGATSMGFKGSDSLSSTDGFYVGQYLVFVGGILQGVARRVAMYGGQFRQFGFATAFGAVPANGDPFLVIGGST